MMGKGQKMELPNYGGKSIIIIFIAVLLHISSMKKKNLTVNGPNLSTIV